MSDHIIHISNGKLAEDTPISKVKSMVDAAVATKNIVIHMHGGLVNEDAGRVIAAKLNDVYTDAGAYPIFMVWEAGLIEVLKNNLKDLSGEAFFRLVLKRVGNIVARKSSQDDNTRTAGVLPNANMQVEEDNLDLALDKLKNGADNSVDISSPDTLVSGTTQLTAMEETLLMTELRADFVLQEAVGSISNGLRERSDIENDTQLRIATRSAKPVIASSRTLMDPESIERLIDRPGGELQSRGIMSSAKVAAAIISIAKNVIARWLEGRFHGVHATIVEETLRELYLTNLGGAIWSQMKKDTKDSFGNNESIYGGTALLSLLNDKIGTANDVKITLVGHSTGAVFIAHLLEKAQEIRPSGFDFNVVLLAPASTFELTNKSFHDYSNQISGFRIFTMTNENEKADRLVPVLYPHSLLYFVSGVVEFEPDAPLVGMQRFYSRNDYPAGEFADVESFRDLTDYIDNSIVWSISENQPDGLNTKAVRHGDFDDDDLTQASMKHIIANGF